ncbi:MAG: DUF3892 domain-containing protein [Syntrophomonadaceae bacterium]
MTKITEIMRNHNGEVVKVVLENGTKLGLEELFSYVESGEVRGAYIEVDAAGDKHLHLTGDGDSNENLDSLTLI